MKAAISVEDGGNKMHIESVNFLTNFSLQLLFTWTDCGVKKRSGAVFFVCYRLDDKIMIDI